MKDKKEILSICERMLLEATEQEANERVILFLRQQNFSKVQTILLFSKATGMSMDQAKLVVHFSQAWQDVQALDTAFHRTLERVLLDTDIPVD